MGMSTTQLDGTRAQTTFTCMSHQAENLSRPKSVKLEMRVHLQQRRMRNSKGNLSKKRQFQLKDCTLE